MNILQIDSSPLGQHSASRTLTQQLVTRLRAATLQAVVVHRDLSANPIRHWDTSAMAPADAADGATEGAVSDTLLREFLAADVIVIGAPMYNFSVPTQLKAWIDRIAVAGRTFRYTAEGPVGLAGGRRVIVASTRGGIYSTSEAARALDHQETWLQAVFGFLGIGGAAFSIVRAEGLALGEAARNASLAAAARQIAELPGSIATPERSVAAAAAA
jgi:FMN-dependent NADH-azoreductase